MTAEDRIHWDGVYTDRDRPDRDSAVLPEVFTPFEQQFPTGGRALELACGRGGATVWLARRGLESHGYDASAIAIDQARELAAHWQVSARCRFSVVDLDHGLPPGSPVEVILCHRFRAPHLNDAIIDRLVPGGLLAIAVLSEVDAAPGPYRAVPGELAAVFANLDLIAAGEGQGVAWLLARK